MLTCGPTIRIRDRGTLSDRVITWWMRKGIRAEAAIETWLNVLAAVKVWKALTGVARAVRSAQAWAKMTLSRVKVLLKLLQLSALSYIKPCGMLLFRGNTKAMLFLGRIMTLPLSVRAKLSSGLSILQLIPTSPSVPLVVLLALVVMTVILLPRQWMRPLRTRWLQGSGRGQSRLVTAKWCPGMLLQAQMFMMLGIPSVCDALTEWTPVWVQGSCPSPMTSVLVGIRLFAQMG